MSLRHPVLAAEMRMLESFKFVDMTLQSWMMHFSRYLGTED